VGLQDEIDSRGREIKTDSYSMSIGELLNLYRDEEIDIHPEFQRIFRWSLEQKSRLIESIFLGIPVPPIFVAQRQDGVWDVVDGVQRLSTILQFTGVLAPPPDDPRPLRLAPTEYLPSLADLWWGDEEQEPGEAQRNALDDAQRRYFKRAKIDFIIVRKESDPNAKYDLFERLNSGSHLSDQEARNCLAVMLDATFYRWLLDLAGYEPYIQCLSISSRKEQEGYGVENVLRYLAGLATDESELERMGDVGEFLTRRMRAFVDDPHFDREEQGTRFRRTFDLLSAALAEDTFRRYDPERGRHVGAFSISAFETVAVGLGNNVEAWPDVATHGESRQELVDRIRSVWENTTFVERAGGGKPASQRMPHLVMLGKSLFVR
jgi:hypothetical protein